MEDFERKMAWVARIDEIKKHPNADAIELAIIGGWQVVVKIGEFKAGDLVIYCSIDSWIPTALAPFLSGDRAPRVYNDVPGERLRTVKLRSELSQGLVLPISLLEERVQSGFQEGDDVGPLLGIQKWEQPINPQLAGVARGNFPSWIRKTDAERVQNLKREVFGDKSDPDMLYEVTVKVDGSSMTVGYNNGELVVCSRNINLRLDSDSTAFVRMAGELGLIDSLPKIGRNIAIQGELYGDGIQGNPEKISGQKFAAFNIWDIDAQKYLPASERLELVVQLGIPHTKILHEATTLKDIGCVDMESVLKYAEGPSLNPNTSREGLVFKSVDGSFMWKAISNTYLLKHG